MANLKEKHEMLDTKNEGHPVTLSVTHINIRQSISFLLIRLVVLEFVSILLLIISLVFFFNPEVQDRLGDLVLMVNIPFFVCMVLLKTSVMLFIILQWLNEYYEINSKYVIHRKGFIFKKEERYVLAHLGKVRLEQGIMGKILNYGNVKIFNWALEKEITFYLIHNPMKTVRVLHDILPESDEEKETLREHFIEEDKE